MERFLGYHSEWNLGSPGGWDYQRMAQELGRLSWERIKKLSGIEIELDFDHPILNPVPAFAELLLRVHKRSSGDAEPFIALVAEEETLEKVGENIHFIDYLNSMPGVAAALTTPQRLKERAGEILLDDRKVTVIFLDFNNDVLVKLRKKYDLEPLLCAIKKGIVVNPRGMEPIGAKALFEVVTGQYRDELSETTVSRTPWTRRFQRGPTTGPSGEETPDLVEWVKENWDEVVLKPVHGYSGKGILIGYQHRDQTKVIQQALETGGYIVQPLIPLYLWEEEFPWVDKEEKKVFIKRWQTDFRSFVTDIGLIGFVTRFGGVPTNVGSGGGVQPTAILKSEVSVKEAVRQINEVIVGLGYEAASEIQDEVDNRSIEMGNVYLLGPIMTTLRPRIITLDHLEQLKRYSQDLWRDAMKLEGFWREGKLTDFVKICEAEAQIASLAPWEGRPGLIAADGLFSFGGHPEP